jgi:hypothetical protein
VIYSQLERKQLVFATVEMDIYLRLLNNCWTASKRLKKTKKYLTDEALKIKKLNVIKKEE